MGKHTLDAGKRTRKGPNPLIPNAAGEGESVHSAVSGDGETSPHGHGAPQDAGGAAEAVKLDVMTCAEICELALKANSWETRITCIYHPKPDRTVFDTPEFGGIRVEAGDCGFMLSDGTRVQQ